MRDAGADPDEFVAVGRKERAPFVAAPCDGLVISTGRFQHRPDHRDDPEHGQAAKDQQHRIGGADQAVADIADSIAGEQQHRRPDERRGNVGEPEAAARHLHDAGGERDHGAHRAEKAADEDALAAVLLKKPDAVRQQVRVARERPDPADPAAIAVAEPERHRVAEHRADDGSRQHRPIGQRARRHQGPGDDQDRRAGKQQAR